MRYGWTLVLKPPVLPLPPSICGLMHRGRGKKQKSGSLELAINAEVCPALQTFAGYKDTKDGPTCRELLALQKFWLLNGFYFLPYGSQWRNKTQR